MTIDLGRFGIWQPAFLTSPEMAVAIETLGFRTVWVAGPQTDLAGIDDLLEATRSLVVATSILNVWHGDSATAAAAYHRISDRFPGRFWLGLGMGHREQNRDYSKPLTRLSEYLDGLDAGGVPIEGRALAALGPKALALSAERSGGAVPYLVTPRHTELARGALGPDRVLAPEHKVVLEPNPERARARARPRIKQYLGLTNYTNNLRRLGFSDEDLSGEGSDRLIDALVAHGDADAIGRHLGDHINAGADHVAIQVLGSEHRPHPSRPDVLIQVYGDEVFEAYKYLADKLLGNADRITTC